MRKFLIIGACMALAGCETTGQRGGLEFKDYPETHAWTACVLSHASSYAAQRGSPYELGAVAADSCMAEQLAVTDALRRNENPAVARGISEGLPEMATRVAARRIVKVRGGA